MLDHQSHYAGVSEVVEGVEVAVLEAVAVIGVAEVTALHPWVDWEARGCLALYCVEAVEAAPNLSQLQVEEVVDPKAKKAPAKKGQTPEPEQAPVDEGPIMLLPCHSASVLMLRIDTRPPQISAPASDPDAAEDPEATVAAATVPEEQPKQDLSENVTIVVSLRADQRTAEAEAAASGRRRECEAAGNTGRDVRRGRQLFRARGRGS